MAKDKNTLTIRYAADGSDQDIKNALKPYADTDGGESGRAKRLIRRALGLPDPDEVRPMDEGTYRRILREELGRIRVAGGSSDEQGGGGTRGAIEEA